MRDSEFKKNIDAATLRYFPWIGNCWVRLVISMIVFFPYAYLIFPFRSLTTERMHSFLLVCLFSLFVMADGSFLLMDVKAAPLSDRKYLEGEMVEFIEGRGVGGSKGFWIENEGEKLFKLASVRSRSSVEALRQSSGEVIKIWYQEASGLLSSWNLPVHIETSLGVVIYDYSKYRPWFENPMNNMDRFWVWIYKVYIGFLLAFFPLQFIYRLKTKEGK